MAVPKAWVSRRHVSQSDGCPESMGVPKASVSRLTDSTRREDQDRKKRVYASLGVGEYFLCDPTGDYLRPRLQGYVLRQGHYERLPMARLGQGEPYLHSEAVGLRVVVRATRYGCTTRTRGVTFSPTRNGPGHTQARKPCGKLPRPASPNWRGASRTSWVIDPGSPRPLLRLRVAGNEEDHQPVSAVHSPIAVSRGHRDG